MEFRLLRALTRRLLCRSILRKRLQSLMSLLLILKCKWEIASDALWIVSIKSSVHGATKYSTSRPKSERIIEDVSEKNHIKQKPELEVLVVCANIESSFMWLAMSWKLKMMTMDPNPSDWFIMEAPTLTTPSNLSCLLFIDRDFSVAFSWPIFLNREIF